MYGKLSLKLRDLNEHLVCTLCSGYYVDATTIIECLHSFCRSCIVSYLATNKCCPKCEVPAHKTRPLLNIRSDKTLQDIVYKLVPGLCKNELMRKKIFSKETGIPVDTGQELHRKKAPRISPEKSKLICLSMEEDKRNVPLSASTHWTRKEILPCKRYLRCPDVVTVATVNKLLKLKLQGKDDIEIITFCQGEVLPESYSLVDVSNTFTWKPDCPLSLTYMAFILLSEGEASLRKMEVDDHEEKENCIDQNDLLPPPSPPADVVKSESFQSSPVDCEMKPCAPNEESNNGMKLVVTRTQAPSLQNKISSSHTKNMSYYSVINVPHEVDKERQQAQSQEKDRKSEAMMNQQLNPSKFTVPRMSNSPEKIRNIDSIANRLQMKQKLQSTYEHQTPVSSFVKTSSDQEHIRQSQTSIEQRGHSTVRKFNSLTNDEAHNLALECVRSKMHLIKSTSSVSVHSPRKQGPANQTAKYVQLARRPDANTRLLQQSQQFQRAQHQVGSPRQASRNTRIYSKDSEDLQLLSTTRQLATLRQQQKMLNEIAAAVASGSNASFSGAKPRITMPIRTSSSASIIPPRNEVKKINSPSRYSLITGSRPSGSWVSQNNNIQPTMVLTDVPHAGKKIGYPMTLSVCRDAGKDLYQNTIEKAKACVRELKMKSPRPSFPPRAASAPYSVPRKILPKYPQSGPRFSAPSIVNMHRMSVPPQNTSIVLPVKQTVSNVFTPISSSVICSPRSNYPLQSNRVSAPISQPPEQDQPLCLVMKK